MAVALEPDVVLPRLRGSFGREYHHAVETASTQRMFPPDAAHGAVALAEHQTEGRGRLGRVWVDEPGAGFVERDRLELLVAILAGLERGYEDWVTGR